MYSLNTRTALPDRVHVPDPRLDPDRRRTPRGIRQISRDGVDEDGPGHRGISRVSRVNPPVRMEEQLVPRGFAPGYRPVHLLRSEEMARDEDRRAPRVFIPLPGGSTALCPGTDRHGVPVLAGLYLFFRPGSRGTGFLYPDVSLFPPASIRLHPGR